MNENKWEDIKQFYMDNFSIPGDIVDLLADRDILTMCAAGASNESISTTLNVDKDSIGLVIKAIFDFDGWDSDLEINPQFIFNSLRDNGKHLFKDFKAACLPIKDEIAVGNMYRLCKRYERICNLIDRKWV